MELLKENRHRFFIIIIFLLSSLSIAQQPANTINVVTDAGAVGDGINNDTPSINSAIQTASSQGKSVYFPPGTYSVSGHIQVEDKVSLYGDSTGLSIIAAIGTIADIGDQEWGQSVDDINIVDLNFLNVTIFSKGGYYKERHVIRRCIFMANDAAFNKKNQINWSYITDGLVIHNIFLRQAHCREEATIHNYKTKRCEIRENVWGLDLNQTEWLATEWSGYASWSNLLEKLQTLRIQFDLDWDQGQIKAGYYPNRVIDEKIYNNIFNGSPFYEGHQDHVVYSKDFVNLQVVGNWMRGWPVDPSGGLKMRNAEGPGLVAANHFVNTPFLQYTYDQTGVPKSYKNVLIYRNLFDINKGLNFNRLGLSYWEDNPIGNDVNIEYDKNIYNCEPGIGNIHLGSGSNLAEHKVYPTNYYAGTSTLIPLSNSSAVYATGEPDSARIAPFVDYPIPSYSIPEYSIPTSIENEDINSIPSNYLISQNYPNPFNPATNIIYHLSDASVVKISVFNSIGQNVAVLVNGFKNAGRHTVTFNAKDLSNGVYYYKITAGDFVKIKKMILLK